MQKSLLITGMLLFTSLYVFSQSIYLYPLKDSFLPIQSGGPELVVIPNNQGLTGEFVTRDVPESTCGTSGTAGGYFFEDDAGFQFNNPPGFIGEAYSLAFNFQVDEFITPPPWVRILSFTHKDDVGVYIYLTDPPDFGTLEFWPYGTVGEENFFSPAEFYQLILVRNTDGLIKIYVNGQEFAEYDDSGTMKYLPQDPDNYIVFFRDHPSVLADEASPGFVSALRITNLAWSAMEVQAIWEEFCSSLLDAGEIQVNAAAVVPNPASNHIKLENLNTRDLQEYIITDLTGRSRLQGRIGEDEQILDISLLSKGMYILCLKHSTGLKTIKFVKQ
jgi:hypothetical protein